MIPEWVREEIEKLQQRVEKLEKQTRYTYEAPYYAHQMEDYDVEIAREPAYKAELQEERRRREQMEGEVNILRLENDELRKKAKRISSKLLEYERLGRK